MLRVIANHDKTPSHVVTVFLDRSEDPPMKLKVGQQSDALYLTLNEAPANRSEEVSPGILVDYDDQDRVVGAELLYLSKRAP